LSFSTLKVEDLKKVADFFVVDVDAADPEKGPTKKELLAALASGDDPVTWEQYKDIYLPAVESGNAESDEIQEEDEPVVEKKVDKYADSDRVLIKYERKNPTFEVLGFVFTTRHPFANVPSEVADYLVRNVDGFRPAMPSELTDYYN
jgi:hypothetical protein